MKLCIVGRLVILAEIIVSKDWKYGYTRKFGLNKRSHILKHINDCINLLIKTQSGYAPRISLFLIIESMSDKVTLNDYCIEIFF